MGDLGISVLAWQYGHSCELPLLNLNERIASQKCFRYNIVLIYT
jgi:hypothetical protein